MNTNHTRPIRTAAFASAVVAVLVTTLGAPASAEHPGSDRKANGRATTVSYAAYATPLSALDGLCLAQYLQRHQQNPRTATVI